MMETGAKLKKTFYVDGRFLEEDKAVIPVNDLSVLRGFGVCDLMRTYGGRPFFLKEHIERLIRSAGEVHLGIPWTLDQIQAIVIETLKKNSHLKEANIRIVITGGSSADFMTPMGSPRLLVLITEIPPLPDTWYKDGIKVITIKSEREIPKAKSISYIPATLALKKAREQGAAEALLIDRNNFIKEGTTSNVFIVSRGILITPDKGVLKGITRKVTLEIAETILPTELREISMGELKKADEVFITGTNKGIVPVVKIDDGIIGTGRPGPMTHKVIQALEAQTSGDEF